MICLSNIKENSTKLLGQQSYIVVYIFPFKCKPNKKCSGYENAKVD